MNGKELLKGILLTLLLVMLLPAALYADPGNQYCITPPFITAGVKPNLLLMIDNSASMYDLAYVDQGKKHCAVSTGTACFSDTECTGKCSNAPATSCTQDSECPSSGTCDTCSVFERRPYYCYDETYKSTTDYYGYFDKDTFYSYRSGTDDFAPVASAFPAGCGSVSAGSTTKSIANTMCVEYLRPSTLYSFVAKGNYLNWLTASKFDIEKKILTGGKFNGSALIPESRGCVGQGFVKDADTADFVNYAGTDINNTNTGLGVTFSITGPSNPFNKTAPSAGGETFINLYAGDTPYNAGKCQAAITAIASASGTGQVADAVADCLAATSPPTGTCSISNKDPITGAAIAQPCVDTAPPATPNCQPPAVPNHCAKNSAITTCTPGVASPLDGCYAAGNVCSAGKVGISCTVASDCDLKACSGDLSKTCSATTPDCQKAEVMGTCKNGSAACRIDGDCSGKNNYCQNYAAGYNYGTCGVKTAGACTAGGDQGPCLYATGGNLGVCQFSPHETLVKTSVFFGSSMQTCWAQRKNGVDPGHDDYIAIVNNCPIIYAGYKSCSNNSMLTCTAHADCGAGNTCKTGPDAIGPGNSALLCGMNYEGKMFVNNPAGSATWEVASALPATVPAACSAGDTVEACILKINKSFCNNLSAPAVTDPTDAPSDTATTDNLPAILSGIGVDAQMGGVIKTMRARVAVSTPACTTNSDCVSLSGTSCVGGACKPTGLVQQFSNNIRLGAMSFNPFGSGAETALTGIPETCNSGSLIGNVCTDDVDCGGAVGSCTAATNLDGGGILYPIGFGLCATMTATPCNVAADCSGFNTCLNGYCGTKGTDVCTTAANCSGSNQACIGNSVGDHETSATLVKILDDVKGSTWTPFSEAFYNAIGYFARVPSGADAGKSRTALRLNSLRTTSTDFSDFTTAPADFNETLNPSEFRCQQNYLLLVSDGSSTADRRTEVNSLATLYASQAEITQITCPPSGPTTDYGGNNNLPIMSWLAKNRKIADFSTASPASTETPTTARDSITSYVVFNGESNGASGDCNSRTLLTKTAAKGGTVLRQATDYPSLVAELTSVFQDVAAKAASGTAASILSNSEGSGANILQAVFYPKKIFESQTAVNWVGEMQNLWYFVDPFVNNSTIREDTDGPAADGTRTLNLVTDLVARFAFDVTSDRTMVQLYQDSDGDGSADATVGGLIDPDVVKSIWRAGDKLYRRDLSTSQRTIYTPLISGGTEVSGSGMMQFTFGDIGATTFPDHSTILQPYLQLATNAATVKLMKFVHGFGSPAEEQAVPPTMRSRTVKIGNIPAPSLADATYNSNPRDKGIGVWKLGDIISSTPRVQSTVRLNTYNLPSPGGYGDKSYDSFINSREYQERGMVYVGANDGMLHAFNLGTLKVKASGFEKATLEVPVGTSLGEEKWAFIPKNFLPYLKYQADPAYQHLYAVDGRTLILDASIGDTGTGACIKDTYWKCDKLRNGSIPMVDASNNLDPTKNVWRTVVIGGMGLGGASRRLCPPDVGVVDDACVKAPINDPADATKSLGYSSYFALDVTVPGNPKLLWEFSDNRLGYSTTGPAIVRVGDKDKNGRWFAVFGNGPFGPIDTATHQFKGGSDHHLRFFIVDLRTGELVKDITTTVDNGFAGSLLAGAIDADRRDKTLLGNYQDDAVYAGYVRKCVAGDTGCTVGTWTNGGVVRIMIDPVPTGSEPDNTWANGAFHWSTVMDGIGPVTTSIARLQDTRALNKKLWLYFGTGRYYYRDGTGLDDYGTVRSLYGVKEPCYNTAAKPGNVLDPACTASISSGIENQTTTINTVDDTDKGWLINLDDDTTSEGAERVVTDTVALTNGAVFFTSFKPTMDVCGFGGNSFLWGIKYDTGGQAAANALVGKALIQLSTGEFKEVNLQDAFNDKLNRRMATPMTGKPPSDAPPIVSSSQNKPVKKILHIQER